MELRKSTSADRAAQDRALTAADPVDGFSAGLKDESNLFEWEIMIIGPNDTLYEGGFLKAELVFPPEYPLLPPKMKFKSPMWHPNSASSAIGARR